MKVETKQYLIDSIKKIQATLTKLGADLIEMEEDE